MMEIKDITDEYNKCPNCFTVMFGEKNILNNQIGIELGKSNFFKVPEIEGYVEIQCPKCFRVWRVTFKEGEKNEYS